MRLVRSLATTWPQLLLIRPIERLGKLRDAPRDALIADSIDEQERGKSFGFHKMFDTIGAAIGPLFAFLLLRAFQGNFRPVFLLSFVAGAIAVVTLIFFTKDIAVPKEKQTAQRKPILIDIKVLLHKPFLLFLIASTVFALGNSSDAFLLLRAQDLGIAVALIPIVYFLFNTVFAGLSYPLGILSDKIDRRVLIIAGYLIFVVVYLGMATAHSPWHAWALMALYGCYYAFTEGVQKALIADLVPIHLRATAYGTFNTVTGLALLPASIIAGSLWQRFGSSSPFLYGSGMALLAVILFIPLLFPKNPKRIIAARTKTLPYFPEQTSPIIGRNKIRWFCYRQEETLK